MKTMKYFIPTFILLTHAAWAQKAPLNITYDAVEERNNCSEFDLRPEMLRMGIPARNYQGESGWCYAFVAADMVSYELGVSVSAADIAINHINSHPQQMIRSSHIASIYPLGGGFAGQAIGDLNHRGVCLDSDYSIDLSVPEATSIITVGPNGQAIKTPPPETILNYGKVSELFPNQLIKNLLRNVRQNSFRQALNQLAESSCTPQFSDIKLETESYTWRPNVQKREEFNSRLDQVLNRRQMLALAYDPSITGRNMYSVSIQTNPSDSHISTIVGSRFNSAKGRCEILLRNTERECDSYNTDFECRDNHLWIPKKLMKIGSTTIYSLI